jgi:soluble P-type ATPase
MMVEVDIPGFGNLRLDTLVLDYNGTLAKDGVTIEGVRQRLQDLSSRMTIHVVTADTFGRAREGLARLPVTLKILDPTDQAEKKRRYVKDLGFNGVVAIGNGRNDRLMLTEAAIGIAVCEGEGLAAVTLGASDVCVRSVTEALDLLLNPMRLVATLRS